MQGGFEPTLTAWMLRTHCFFVYQTTELTEKKVTQEMPLLRSTASRGTKRRRDEEKIMTKQTPYIKPQTRIQRRTPTEVSPWNGLKFSLIFLTFKGSISLKNRHFTVQERFNKLIYGTNTNINMWHLTACNISVSLSFLKWNDVLSYLWIDVANINSEIR